MHTRAAGHGAIATAMHPVARDHKRPATAQSGGDPTNGRPARRP